MSFGIDDAKSLEKQITICTKIEDLKISEFNVYQSMMKKKQDKNMWG